MSLQYVSENDKTLGSHGINLPTHPFNFVLLALCATAKDFISQRFGSEFSTPRNYSTKSKGAQEAHEAIRPTDMSLSGLDGGSQEARLYELIWKRAIASPSLVGSAMIVIVFAVRACRCL